MADWMRQLRLHIRDSKDAEHVLTTLRYRGPGKEEIEALRKLALGEETALMRIQRLLDAVTGPKRPMTFFFEPALAPDLGEEASTTFVRIAAPEGEEAVVTIALEDAPELRAKYPSAHSLTVFGKPGKNASKVRTRIALHEQSSPEHQALEAAPKRLRRMTLDVPEDFLGEPSGLRGHVSLHEAIPACRFIVSPHYSDLTMQPLIAVSDATVVELEEDEGALLIFESGISRHRYA